MLSVREGGSKLQLGALQDEILGHIFTHLEPGQVLSTVPLVCKRWYRACRGHPALWKSIEFVLTMDSVGVSRLQGFQRWLVPRARHVLSFHLCSMGAGIDDLQQYESQAWKLIQQILYDVSGSLETLDLQWFGRIQGTNWVLGLQQLRVLELDSLSLSIDCSLSSLSQLTRLTVYSVEGELQWLPALNLLPISLQCLSVIHASPLRLPPCLPHLPSLARLHLSECSLVGEDGDDFAAPLVAATQLQHLAIHMCTLPQLPTKISCLTNLQALLLDSNTHPQNDEALGEVLATLQNLQLLGLSCCKLRSLPHSITTLTSLRCLYTEDNRLEEIPSGDYLRGLAMLSLDWRTLLGGRGAATLSATTALHTVYICKPFPYLAPQEDSSRQVALQQVIDVLGSHLSLKRMVFVLYESERLSQQVEVASQMLALSKGCPRLKCEVLRYDHFFAAGLDTLDKAVAEQEEEDSLPSLAMPAMLPLLE